MTIVGDARSHENVTPHTSRHLVAFNPARAKSRLSREEDCLSELHTGFEQKRIRSDLSQQSVITSPRRPPIGSDFSYFRNATFGQFCSYEIIGDAVISKYPGQMINLGRPICTRNRTCTNVWITNRLPQAV